ncbi:MAG: hypothetical protein JO062_11730 [Bryobacterales bacterium]|nr:hypothetical protein [Bryobacterales bacterium]
MRPVILFRLAALTCLSPTSRVQANPMVIGGQVFTDIGNTTVDTGNIFTATTVTLGDWISTASNIGIFAGMPIQFFGTVSFNITDPSSLTFGNGVFGAFDATALTVVAPNPPAIINFVYDGLWTPGTQGGLTGGPLPSSINITFVQGQPPGIRYWL